MMEDDDPNTWYKLYSQEGTPYYYNRGQQLTQWEVPDIEPEKIVDLAQNEDEDPNRQLTEEEEAVIEMEREIARIKAKAEHAEKALRLKQETLKRVKQDADEATTLFKAAVWVKKYTNMTQGLETGRGDAYYYNLETGETQWEKPDDYMTEEEIREQKMRREIDFDLDKDVMEILQELDVTTDVFVTDREFLYGQNKESSVLRDKVKLSKRQVADRCSHRMKQFFLAFKYTGDTETWKNIFSRDDFAMARNIFCYWGPKVGTTPDDVRMYACRLFVSISSIFPSVLPHCIDGSWEGAEWPIFLKHCEKGISAELKKGALKEPDTLKAFVVLMLQVLFNASEHVKSSAEPSEGFIKDLVSVMAEEDEKIYLLTARLVFYLMKLYIPPASDDIVSNGKQDPKPIVAALLKSSKSHILCEAILHFLNVQHYPYTDEKLLDFCLHATKAIVGSRKSSVLFSRSDYNVILDIVIIELANLPSEDKFRVEYIRILFMIMENSEWRSGGRYRRDDITKALDQVVAAKGQGIDDEACTLATRILMECQDDLT